MNYKLIISACILGLILAEVFIHIYKRNPDEYTELNFIFVKKQGIKDTIYRIYFDTPVETEEKTFSYNGDFYTVIDYSDGIFLLAKYPKKVKTDEIFNFYFQITNHLGKDRSYVYYIYLNDKILRKEEIFIKNMEKKTVKEELSINTPGRNKISIKLDTGEEIHFYTECEI